MVNQSIYVLYNMLNVVRMFKIARFTNLFNNRGIYQYAN